LKLTLPSFATKEIEIDLKIPAIPSSAKTAFGLLGKNLPATKLVNSEGRSLTTSYLGKPTILTFLNTWSPLAVSQLGDLEVVARNKDVNLVVIVPQESAASLTIFQKRGGYKLTMLADPDGELVEVVNLNSVPTHLFINRKGVVQKVKVGLMPSKELLENLVN